MRVHGVRGCRTLVRALARAPETASRASLDVVPAAERRQVVEDWNATARAYPREESIHGLFEAQAARTPEAVAVVCGDECVSYAKLDSRATKSRRTS